MNQFWMVHGDGPCNVRHQTREDAEREADRLARANPSKVFFVTEAVTAHVKHDVERIDLRCGGGWFEQRMPPDQTCPIHDPDFDEIPF